MFRCGGLRDRDGGGDLFSYQVLVVIPKITSPTEWKEAMKKALANVKTDLVASLTARVDLIKSGKLTVVTAAA